MPVQDCSLQNAWSLSSCEKSKGWNVFGWLFFPNSLKLHSWILGKFFPTASGSKSPFYFILPLITSCTMAVPSLSTFFQTLPPEQTHLAHGKYFLKLAHGAWKSHTWNSCAWNTEPAPPAKGRACIPWSLPGGIAVFQLVSQPVSMLMCSQRILKYSCCQYNQGRIPASHGFPVSVPPSQEKHSMKAVLSLPWKGHLQWQNDQGGKEVWGRTKTPALKAQQF